MGIFAGRNGLVIFAAGILSTALGLFAAFPIGCNLATSCLAAPIAWWGTYWANTLAFSVGLLLIAMGIGACELSRFPLGSVGIALVVVGLFLNSPGMVLPVSQGSTYFMTSCPGKGCPALTFGQWWSIFWPGVVVGVVGAATIFMGAVLMLYSRRPIRPVTWILVILATCLVSAGLGGSAVLFRPFLMRATIKAQEGEYEEARNLFSAAMTKKDNELPPTVLAWFHLFMGNKDKAFEFFEKAYQERDFLLGGLKTDPDADSIRSDPRYLAIIAKMGL